MMIVIAEVTLLLLALRKEKNKIIFMNHKQKNGSS